MCLDKHQPSSSILTCVNFCGAHGDDIGWLHNAHNFEQWRNTFW